MSTRYRRARNWSRRNAAPIQKWLTIVWIILVFPSVTLWRESVPWLVFMSVWANVAGHWAAYEATQEIEPEDDDD